MFRKALYILSGGGAWISGIALIVMMGISVSGIILRFMDLPTTNFYECITISGMLVFVSSWAYAQKQKVHLQIDLLTSRLPIKIRSILNIMINVLSVATSWVMVWYSLSYGIKLYHSGRFISYTFQFPIYILALTITVFIALFSLVLFLDLYDSLMRRYKEEIKA